MTARLGGAMQGRTAREDAAKPRARSRNDKPAPGGAPGERGPASRRIETALIDDIAAGLLSPGERLDETRLAARFGTSRTPVREALSRLAASGVVSGGGGRGLRVARYDREELAQMFEAMHELEVVCAGLAAKRMTFLARAELEAAQDACLRAAEAGDRTAYLKANEAFHLVIYEATQNRYVAEMAADFRRRTGPFRAKKFATHGDLLASARSHEALLETIFSSDDEIASQGMRDHMRRSYLDVLAANREDAAGG